MPLTLQLTPDLDIDGVIPLQALVRHWFGEHGMCQALTGSQDVLCLHIDRLCQDASGTLVKLDTPLLINWGVEIPEFEGDGLAVAWNDYQVSAIVAHTGTASQGHYECLLRTSVDPTARGCPQLWLHVDDNRAASPCWCWDPPTNFMGQATMLWLCKASVFEPHAHYMDVAADDVRSRADAMMQILTSTPG
eukprot:s4358_g4.t1